MAEDRNISNFAIPGGAAASLDRPCCEQFPHRKAEARGLSPGSQSLTCGMRRIDWFETRFRPQEHHMSVARHPRPPELVGVPVEEIMSKYVGRFKEKKPDWAAFEDA